MHTNGNGNGHGGSFMAWERRLWEAADPEMHETTMQAVHVQDRQTKSVLIRLLTFVKQLRETVSNAGWAIERLFAHGVRQQHEICALEADVRELRALVEILARKEGERATTAALEALEAGEDTDAVLDRLGRDRLTGGAR